MAGRQKDIIKEKKRVFKDWGIKWDAAIEEKLKKEMATNPRADPEVVLDRITHDIIRRKIESL